MGVVTRPDSKFFWLNLERPGQRVIRESTKIPVHGDTPEQLKANKALAVAAYNARMGDLARKRYGLHVDRPRVTFKAYRTVYEADISAHKRSAYSEGSLLRRLGVDFDRYDLADIDVELVRAWRTTHSTRLKPSSINRAMALLKHILASAVPKYLEANPIAGLSGLREPEDETRILEADEEARLLAALKDDVPMTAFVLTALDTLQRLSSVADLRRAQDHGAYLTFLNTKTKGGKVPVSRRLRAALDAHLATLPATGVSVFPAIQGGTAAARRVRVIRSFQAACTTAQIDGFTFHGLRHTGASRMLHAKVDIETVRRIGGWSNYDVLKRYLHPTDSASRDAVETIGTVPYTSRA